MSSTAGTSVTSYAYGLNGELDSVTSPTGMVQYAYGLDGNIYNAVLADGRALALAYDESGNRIQRNVNGVMTAKWVWDTNASLPVRTNESGTTTWRWFEDPQSSLGTAVASVSKDGEPTWLLTDFSGTTLTTTKTGGASTNAKFDPFGNILSGSMSQPLQFHGQYKDSVLGLYDMRQRDYNPVTGMFLSTDPIAVPVGDPFISRYSYGFNNPLVFTDASGLEARRWADGRLVGVPGVGSISAAQLRPAFHATPGSIAGLVGSVVKGALLQASPISQMPRIIRGTPAAFKDPSANFNREIDSYKQGFEDIKCAYTSAWAMLNGTGTREEWWHDATHQPAALYVGDSWDKGDYNGVAEKVGTGIGIVAQSAIPGGPKIGLKIGGRPSAVPMGAANTASDVADVFLYQKLSSTGEHLKYGITKNPATRYSPAEMNGGSLNILAEGPKPEMLALERALHETLPIGPEEGQLFYIQKQVANGLRPPPYTE